MIVERNETGTCCKTLVSIWLELIWAFLTVSIIVLRNSSYHILKMHPTLQLGLTKNFP